MSGLDKIRIKQIVNNLEDYMIDLFDENKESSPEELLLSCSKYLQSLYNSKVIVSYCIRPNERCIYIQPTKSINSFRIDFTIIPYPDKDYLAITRDVIKHT